MGERYSRIVSLLHGKSVRRQSPSFHRKEGVSTRAPSLGRGCRAQRGGVGFRSRLKRNGKRRSLVSSSRAQPRDLFRFPFPFSFVSRLHETPSFRFAGSTVLPARRYPHILCLTANEKDFSLSLEMTIWGKRYPRIVAFPIGEGGPRSGG